MVREEKAKCFEILSSYLARTSSNTEYVTSMWQAIDICESMVGEQSNLAMKLVKNGLHLMEERMKRRTVMLAADFCSNTVVKVRRLAFEVMLQAFEDIQSSEDLEPAAKRRKAESTKILDLLQVEDVYTLTVVAKLGQGLVDEVADISSMVQQGVVKHLSSVMSVRLCECMLIALNQPASVKPSVVARALTAAVRMWVQALRDMDAFKTILLRDEPLEVDSNLAVRMWVQALRDMDAFKAILLRDEPLEVDSASTSAGPSKLLTMTRTYQGTFRTHFSAGRKNSSRKDTTTQTMLNVQIPIDEILETLLQFSERDPDTATTLLTEVIKSVQKQQSFDFNSRLSQLLCSLLDKGVTLRSTLLVICRCVLDDCCKIPSFKTSLLRLKETTLGPEAECITSLLYEDVVLRTENKDMFVLGNTSFDEEDEQMEDSSLNFSLQDLISTFDKLSNWDILTIQEKKKIQRSSLPMLWTDHDTFAAAFNSSEELPPWLNIMRLSLDHNNFVEKQFEWTKQLDVWPKRNFENSAITEAIEWHSIVTESDINKLPRDIRPSDCLAKWALADSNDSEPVLSRAYRARCRSHELRWCERAADLSTSVLSCLKRNVGDLNESETLPWLYQHIAALRTSGLSKNCAEMLSKALAKAEQGLSEFQDKTIPAVIVAMNRMKLLLNNDLEYKSEQTAAISSIASCFGRVLALKHSQKSEMFLSVLLDRLAEYQDVLDEDVAEDLLTKIEAISETLNEFTLSELKRIYHVFPPEVLRKHVKINSKICQDGVENKFKLCLQLVCDPVHSLSQYCYELDSCLKENDGDKFEATFKIIMALTNNEFAGPSFQLLTKYTDALKDIQDYEYTKEYNKKARKAIHDVLTDMSSAQKSSLTLPLSELCPALTSGSIGASEEDRKSLSRLLRLDGLEVVRFDKQVFADEKA
ncbi:hypothetical protein JYU34_018006 [Plutella xylostella]|uniref:Uncharacterized protein n=1 Tax=Plutella xylostella TaxID=51655 RepID=A0ABQ7PZS3_PLUXY|nr:hypothetical protein JYU34_018006 [Plutella xylostella]